VSPKLIHRIPMTFVGYSLVVIFAACSIGCGGTAHSNDSIPTTMSQLLTPATLTATAVPTTLSTPSASRATPQPVTLNYVLPKTIFGGAASLHGARRSNLASSSFTGYVSTALPVTMNLTVTPLGGAAAGPYSGSCTPTSSGTSGTCSVAFSASPGPTLLAGTITESGNAVASFSQMQLIGQGGINNINFTASPVVASVALQLASTSINAGTPQDVTLIINAKDANGNILAGSTPYVDANGNPVVIKLSAINSQNGGRGSALIQGPQFIVAPGQATTNLHYDGQWLDHTTVVASTSSTMVNLSAATATLTTVPHATEYAAAGSPASVAAGLDGNIWFTEPSASAIGKMTVSGIYTQYPCSPCNDPWFMTPGPDGNLWFVENNGAYVDKLTTAGVTTRIAPITGGLGARIRPGPDGNIWYASVTAAYIGKLSPAGVILATYPVPGGGTYGIGFAPDGSLWYASNSTVDGHISLTGSVLGTVTVSAQSGSSGGVIAAPDGNMWSVNVNANELDKITPTGAVTLVALQAGASPRDIVVGPDGNLWFTENGKDTLGYIAPNSVTPTEFAGNGITAGSGPFGMTLGPDGNIWFAERGTNKIAKFVW
jgi:streptogramin lyase